MPRKKKGVVPFAPPVAVVMHTDTTTTPHHCHLAPPGETSPCTDFYGTTP